MFHADFPGFALKSVEHSRYLLIARNEVITHSSAKSALLQCKVKFTPVQSQNLQLHLSMSFRQELKELSGFGREVSHNK
ncbi:hypothetical protein Krac_3272 [Ktedonobacter racemifer DSM 44963]|uniref:Uncharacterized protein n=1 Tax=Ktedonobacter racemifer DSM 44963 TaxID=485913 RepID=D6U0X0_KTERA|nr:hypothetical protein Krac_3272 [Ktedonobacter racemifer DSM 44963]